MTFSFCQVCRSRLHHRLAGGADPLGTELLVTDLGERLRGSLRPGQPGADPLRPGAAAVLAEAARTQLDAHLVDGITMAAVATRLHASPGYVARAFSATFGIAPHAYVLGRRIARARDLLLDGWPPVMIAEEAGFVDQAHLSRHFRRHVRTTPGRFAESPLSDVH